MYAVTVDGLVPSGELGVTLPHEHLYCDLRLYCSPNDSADLPMESIPMDRLRDAPLDFRANLDMRDEALVTEEMRAFKGFGGGAIVELSTVGLAPDHAALRRVSRAAGVHVIAGTGYYTGQTHSDELKRMSVAAIAEGMVREIVEGDSATGIRAGIIGEISTSAPLQASELAVLRAAARAQLLTNCPINIHFAPGLAEVFTVLDVLAAEGLPAFDRVVVSHADDVLDVELHERVMARGAVIEYDTFGNESYPSPWGKPMPTDEERVLAIADLIRHGFLGQILVSHDVCMRSLWLRFGGKGYVNLLDQVAVLFERAGITTTELRRLFIDNPARLLGFVA